MMGIHICVGLLDVEHDAARVAKPVGRLKSVSGILLPYIIQGCNTQSQTPGKLHVQPATKRDRCLGEVQIRIVPAALSYDAK